MAPTDPSRSGLTRRELVVGGTVAGAALVGGGVAGWLLGAGSDDLETERVDVAIVGGGPGGTYAAWRLATAPDGRGRSIALFERTQRIGGRLWSVPVAPVRNQVAELGGMRIPSNHRLIGQLIDHLRLPTIPFYASSPDTLVRLRGRRLRRGDVHRADQFPYDLGPRLGALSPAELIGLVLHEVGIDGPGDTGGLETGPWLDGLSYRGVPLWRLRALDLLESVLGGEGAEFVGDWTAYDLQNIGAAAWIGTVGSVSADRYLGLAGGYQRLPLTLARRAAAAGVAIRHGEELLAVAPANGRVLLELRAGPGNGRRFVSAERVIFALPTAVLRDLKARSPVLHRAPAFTDTLDRIEDREAVKIYLAFEEAWWTKLGLKPGHSTSSGQLKQTFYLPPDREGRALMLANYAFAGDPAGYWGGDLPDDGVDGTTRMPPEVTRELVRKLEELHGIPVPQPVDGRGHWWGRESDGAVSFWREGIVPWKGAAAVRHPVPGLPLWVVGDSLSLNQGWVEGALQTAEVAVRAAFKLQRPGWMNASTPLGP